MKTTSDVEHLIVGCCVYLHWGPFSSFTQHVLVPVLMLNQADGHQSQDEMNSLFSP